MFCLMYDMSLEQPAEKVVLSDDTENCQVDLERFRQMEPESAPEEPVKVDIPPVRIDPLAAIDALGDAADSLETKEKFSNFAVLAGAIAGAMVAMQLYKS